MEAQRLEAELKHLAETWRPLDQFLHVRSGIQNRSITWFYLFLARGKHWVSESGSLVFWGMEGIRIDRTVEIGHFSFELQPTEALQNKASGITSKSAGFVFSDLQKNSNFSSWPRWFGELNAAGTGLIHCYIFSALDWRPSAKSVLWKGPNYGSSA